MKEKPMTSPRVGDEANALFTKVDGVFYRAVDPAYRDGALSGSRYPGRYSSAAQPTLYLSASRDGVAAAMKAHSDNRSGRLEIVSVHVAADRIFDLRDAPALAAMGIRLEDAVAPWQEVVAAGGIPTSWSVRDRLEALGAQGLVDPSRKAPGLWHLVLFSWNQDDSPAVHVIG
jgi:RES domain-containing protein